MPEESEDCLYLNVFAPRDASPTNKKPVLFWLFGGNLQFGTGSLTFYNGSSLAATQDIVVVTINYRTNIFGFSNSPEIPFGSQNSGFLDQRFALAWVTKNIATFGGDPSKVTLFGESAGGESVKQILAQPPSPLPFHGAILESQASVLTGVGSLSYAATVANFRCTTAASPIDCLRKVPATDIKAFIEAQSLAFTPVNNDGTSTTDVRPSIASKKFANVPILIGHNAQDAAAFLAVAGIDNGTAVLDNVLSALHLNESGIVDTILTTYGGDVVDDAYTLASAVATDALFTCPTASLSAYLTTHSYSVWRYLYSASFPNLQLFKCPKDGCAYHTSEIPLAWGTYPLDSFLGPATADEKALSKYMQGVWAGWAKNPKAGPGWPRVGTRLGHELGNIGSKKAPTGEHTDYLLSTDYPCAIYGPVDDALQLSYKV
ncbi:hypothetical protein FH972_025870 [Carpinus fangiana]|uniref:Carboxylic ester hydrolase n=1 Tax=Carpinus fangiana TaxID=176857 RepID=A0A5N6L2U4_9ROSI|nr:hypothetical protein FH972_025870 [Carpinus fangiana]